MAPWRIVANAVGSDDGIFFNKIIMKYVFISSYQCLFFSFFKYLNKTIRRVVWMMKLWDWMGFYAMANHYGGNASAINLFFHRFVMVIVVVFLYKAFIKGPYQSWNVWYFGMVIFMWSTEGKYFGHWNMCFIHRVCLMLVVVFWHKMIMMMSS